MRFLIALILLIGAAALIGSAGGLQILSASDWQQVAQKWALPPASENERCLTLLTGAIVAFLAVARLLSPMPPKSTST
jgi:hypothetical protein